MIRSKFQTSLLLQRPPSRRARSLRAWEERQGGDLRIVKALYCWQAFYEGGDKMNYLVNIRPAWRVRGGRWRSGRGDRRRRRWSWNLNVHYLDVLWKLFTFHWKGTCPLTKSFLSQVMKLRRAAVHKAQPIKHYKPVEVNKEYIIVIHSEAYYDYTKELYVNMK